MDKEVLSTPADAEFIDTSGDENRIQPCETGSQVDGHLGKAMETNKLRWKGLILLAPVQILAGMLIGTSGGMSAKGCTEVIKGYEEVSLLLGAIFAVLYIIMGTFTIAAATMKVKNMVLAYLSVTFFSIFVLGVPPLALGVLEVQRSIHFNRLNPSGDELCRGEITTPNFTNTTSTLHICCEEGLAMSLSMGTLAILAGLSMVVTSVIGFAYAWHALSRPGWTWDWRKELCYMDCCIKQEDSSLLDNTQEVQTNQDGHLDQDGHLILKPVLSDYCCCTQRNSKSSGAFTVLGILHLIVGCALISINMALIFKGCPEMLRDWGFMYVIGILLGLLVAGHGLFGVCAAWKKLSGLKTAYMITSFFVAFGLGALIIYLGSFQVSKLSTDGEFRRNYYKPTDAPLQHPMCLGEKTGNYSCNRKWTTYYFCRHPEAIYPIRLCCQGAMGISLALGCVEILFGVLVVALSLVTMVFSGKAVCRKGNASCLDTNKMPQMSCYCGCCHFETGPRPTPAGDSDDVILMHLKPGMDLRTISRDYPGYLCLINPSSAALPNQMAEATTVDNSQDGVYVVTSREADA